MVVSESIVVIRVVVVMQVDNIIIVSSWIVVFRENLRYRFLEVNFEIDLSYRSSDNEVLIQKEEMKTS